jgi:hypothetical protein
MFSTASEIGESMFPNDSDVKQEDGGDPQAIPKTPSKRKNEAQGGTPKKPKSQQGTPRKLIPETFDDLAEEDKMIIQRREVSTNLSSRY